MFHGIIFKKPPPEAIYQKYSAEAHHLVLDKRQHHIISKVFDNAWFAQECHTSSASFTETHQPHRAIIMAWTRLDNAHELILQHQLNPSISPAELILQLYFKKQEDCVNYLLGDFSFAIYDLKRQYLFCARDPMGIKPLYYCQHALGFAFSTSMRFFHLLGSPKPRLEWVCKKLNQSINAMPFEETVYHQVHRCLPAHFIQASPKALVQRRYFAFHTEKVLLKSSDEYVAYYEASFHKAIQRRANVSHPLGLELSGGLDSSSVTAYALQHYPRASRDCHTFSFALDAEEPQTIFSINQHYAISSAYVCCNPTWYIDFPERACQVFAAPAHHRISIQFEILYQQAQRQGVHTLLSGFGGDECVSGGNFQLYLYEFLANKQYQRIFQDMPGNAITRIIRGLRFLYVTYGKTCVTENAVQKAMQARWPAASIISPSWEDHYQLKKAYDECNQFTQGYHSIDKFIIDYTL